jgi:hypothetical protein
MKYYPRPKAQKKSQEEMTRIEKEVDKIFKRDYGMDFKTKSGVKN